MELGEKIAGIAAVAAETGAVAGALAGGPAGRPRLSLVAFGEDEERRWVVVDGTGAPVDERGLVREVASIVVLCDLAEELAGGGRLDELRAQLAQLRMTEQPPGIEEAEQAAL